MCANLGETVQAVYWYNKAKEHSEFPILYTNLGALLTDLGEFEQAYIELKKALLLEPNNEQALEGMEYLQEKVWVFQKQRWEQNILNAKRD